MLIISGMEGSPTRTSYINHVVFVSTCCNKTWVHSTMCLLRRIKFIQFIKTKAVFSHVESIESILGINASVLITQLVPTTLQHQD